MLIIFPAVVIDETAVGDDAALGIGERANGNREGENAAVLLHSIGGHIVRPFQHLSLIHILTLPTICSV